MIDSSEHIYSDDPAEGHPDVRTRLEGVSYFFLGNGSIQAAVQYAPAGEGTPLGLLIMDPSRLRMKREALTIDGECGLEGTMIRLTPAGAPEGITPATAPGEMTAGWSDDREFPAVQIGWSAGEVYVSELFYCPSSEDGVVIREVRVRNRGNRNLDLLLETAIPGTIVEQEIDAGAGEETCVLLEYSLEPSGEGVGLTAVSDVLPDERWTGYWRELSRFSAGSTALDHYYRAAAYQLPAVVSRSGVVDASIWQYNREWVRDHSFMIMGLVLSGHHELARVMLERLLVEFVSAEGDTIDSSERREPDEVELDQNGELLWILELYYHWSGDLSLASEHWETVVRVADYPFQSTFVHGPTGLLHNSREFWERHRAFGIEAGFELIYQVFNVIGLNSAAVLARLLSREDEASRWEERARRLKEALLDHPDYALHDTRGFIKRRALDGSVQEEIDPEPEGRLAEAAPLSSAGNHFLNPCTSAALPIAMGLVPADSAVAAATMDTLEELWNQEWEGGGYGRYNASSEPDSPGPWSFPSLFMARAAVETGEFDKVRKVLEWFDSVPGSTSGSWFEYYGPRISPPFPQVGIVPWAWGEMIMLVVGHLLGVRPGEDLIRIRPRLLPSLDGMDANLRLRDVRIRMRVRREEGVSSPAFSTDGEAVVTPHGEILLEYPSTDVNLEVTMPEAVERGV